MSTNGAATNAFWARPAELVAQELGSSREELTSVPADSMAGWHGS